MNEALKNTYESHHSMNRRAGFVLMGEDRGKFMRKHIGSGKKILDIGCRDGSLSKHFLKGNEVWGVDIDEESLNRARDLGIKTVLMDLNGKWTELGDEKFDVVVAGEVIEHLYYPEEVIKKIIARLAPNGTFLGSVPNGFSLKNRLRYLLGRKQFTPLADPTHINHFSYPELLGMIRKYFKETKIEGVGRYKRFIKLFPGLFSFIFLFYAKSPIRQITT